MEEIGQCVYWNRLLSFNRIKSGIVSVLTGHNTLRRPLCITGLFDSLLLTSFGIEEENLAHVLCACKSLATLKQTYLVSFPSTQRIF